jgi:hypothetical protein
MLLNLDTARSPKPTPTPSLPTPTSPASVDPATLSKTHLQRDPEAWEWQELRDYVVYEITKMTGEFSGHTNGAAEAQIFRSFLRRHGPNAQRIARYALDTCGGLWYASPVTILDFCKNSDPQFADPILKRLEAA